MIGVHLVHSEAVPEAEVRSLLQGCPGVRVVGEGVDVRGVVAHGEREVKAALVVLPAGEGPARVHLVRRHRPALAVAALSAAPSEQEALAAMALGAAAYVPLEAGREVVQQALEEVATGGYPIARALLQPEVATEALMLLRAAQRAGPQVALWAPVLTEEEEEALLGCSEGGAGEAAAPTVAPGLLESVARKVAAMGYLWGFVGPRLAPERRARAGRCDPGRRADSRAPWVQGRVPSQVAVYTQRADGASLCAALGQRGISARLAADATEVAWLEATAQPLWVVDEPLLRGLTPRPDPWRLIVRGALPGDRGWRMVLAGEADLYLSWSSDVEETAARLAAVLRRLTGRWGAYGGNLSLGDSNVG